VTETPADPRPAPAAIVAEHRRLSEALPFADRQDLEDGHHGFSAALEPAVVRAAGGRVVWDGDSRTFVDGDAPDTVNPSLWRQSQPNASRGLFAIVTP